jgi:hypothetical protein
MKKLLSLSLAVLASAASAAPLENAAAIAVRLGAPSALPAPLVVAAPTPSTKPMKSALKVQGSSGPISGYVSVSGNGYLPCSGPNGSGMMSGWINLRADVNVTTADGAAGSVPVSGTAFVSGSCQSGSGLVSGSAMLNGSGAIYKAGRYAGTAQLSGSLFINQYVSGGFAWINQSAYLSGTYNQTAAR